MQNPKNYLFLYLSPRQKSQLTGTLKVYFKKYSNFSIDEIIYQFLDDEKYYLDIQNPHYEFLKEYLEDDKFFLEIKTFLKYTQYEFKQKEHLKPYIEKQKQYLKEQRKKMREYKMSKLEPTKKQLNYYKRLTELYNIEKKDLKNASRLDLKNWIEEIIKKDE